MNSTETDNVDRGQTRSSEIEGIFIVQINKPKTER